MQKAIGFGAIYLAVGCAAIGYFRPDLLPQPVLAALSEATGQEVTTQPDEAAAPEPAKDPSELETIAFTLAPDGKGVLPAEGSGNILIPAAGQGVFFQLGDKCISAVDSQLIQKTPLHGNDCNEAQ